MIKSFNHVGLSVADLDRSIAFYTEVMGLERLGGDIPFEGEQFERVMALKGVRGRIGVVRKGDLQLELFEFAHPAPAPQDPDRPVADHGLTHFGVEVEDIAATYAKFVAAGVRFHHPVQTFPGGIKAAYGRDPDGNVFELLEMPKGRSA